MNDPVESEATVEHRLLQSVVEVARHTFAAAASSIFLVAPTGELVFEAVAGMGDGQLKGTRFPPGTGIAGWVASSGQSLMIDDLRDSPQFARDAAASTNYVPNSIMAAPLFSADACTGVLEVLDRGTTGIRVTADIELLGLLADQAAIGLELLNRLRSRQPDQRSDRAIRLLDMVESMLATSRG